eukprot:6874428-Alexandrium_andersonii.AAC.1
MRWIPHALSGWASTLCVKYVLSMSRNGTALQRGWDPLILCAAHAFCAALAYPSYFTSALDK